MMINELEYDDHRLPILMSQCDDNMLPILMSRV